MTYKFVPDIGVEMDWKFEGLTWEVETLDDGFYMEGGQFIVAIDENYRSLSSKPNRQGVFEEIK